MLVELSDPVDSTCNWRHVPRQRRAVLLLVVQTARPLQFLHVLVENYLKSPGDVQSRELQPSGKGHTQ